MSDNPIESPIGFDKPKPVMVPGDDGEKLGYEMKTPGQSYDLRNIFAPKLARVLIPGTTEMALKGPPVQLYLRTNNSIYRIEEVDVSQGTVKITRANGSEEHPYEAVFKASSAGKPTVEGRFSGGGVVTSPVVEIVEVPLWTQPTDLELTTGPRPDYKQAADSGRKNNIVSDFNSILNIA